MPQFDRFTAACNMTYFNATYTNIVHFQVIDEQNPANVMNDALSFIQTNWVEQMRTVQPNTVAWNSITVRRLAPAISDVATNLINIPGNKLEGSLPGTLFYLVKYYCQPYAQGTAYHWKLAGVSLVGNNGGNVTDEKLSQFAPVLGHIASGPYTVNGNSFQFTNPHKSSDVAGIAKPVIRRTFVDGTVRNLRSRQVY